jgi:phosphoglycerate dehydrogenase-like enzyme
VREVLVTDSLFVGPAEVTDLQAAGLKVTRLNKVMASEEELKEAIRGKRGYILGGIECVTDAVIGVADQLRAIAFTGSDFKRHIPAWVAATEKGIAISAASGGNAKSVAEYAVAAGLALIRNLPALTNEDGLNFYTAREFDALTVGVVGFGHVGQEVARTYCALGMRVIATKSAKVDPSSANVEFGDLQTLLKESDVVSVHVIRPRGELVLGRRELDLLRAGTIVVNTSFPEAIDNDHLVKRINAGELRAAVDYPVDSKAIVPGALLASNAETAFNTKEANEAISRRVTRSLLNLLLNGDDPDLVNPSYLMYRSKAAK